MKLTVLFFLLSITCRAQIVIRPSGSFSSAPASPSSSASTGYYYNVADYGAVGDSVTDNSSAINSAISAMPATGGVLFFPYGKFMCKSRINLNKTVTVLGNGGGVQFYITGDWSKITGKPTQIITDQNIDLFYITASNCKFTGVSLINTSTTPTAGSGIKAYSNADGLVLRDIQVFNFYDDVDIFFSAQFVFNNVQFVGPVRYGLLIQNNGAADSGDGSISDCYFNPYFRNATAGIRQTSGGGTKLVNCKFNSAGPAQYRFTDAISASIGATVDFLVSNSSFENYSSHAISIAASTGTFNHVVITGNQFAAYYSALSDVSLTSVKGFSVIGNEFDGGGTTPNAIILFSSSNGTMLNSYMNYTAANISQTSSTNIIDANTATTGAVVANTDSTLVFADNFSVDGNLSGYNQWSEVVGTQSAVISSNRVNLGNAENDIFVNSTASQSNVTNGSVSALISLASFAGVGLVFRYQNANNMYFLDIGQGAGTLNMSLYKLQSGTFTQLGSGATSIPNVPVGSNFTASVNFSGSTFTATINGNDYPLPYDATFTTGGKTGLRNGSTGSGDRLVSNYQVHKTL